MKNTSLHQAHGSSPCGGSLTRRDALKLIGVGATSVLTRPLPVMAGPFESPEFDKLVPADKKLDPNWVRSLFERGTRTVYRGAELDNIGMPIGGICSGQLYLGGDGKLWHWDIFNHTRGTSADHYAHPLKPSSPLEQGFALRTVAGGKTQTRALDRAGFSQVSFSGEYPIGAVEYTDPTSPVTVSLEAFSPFIPLAADDSSLPATLMQFRVKNVSPDPIEATLAGWLQNGVGLHSGRTGRDVRRNQIVRGRQFLFLNCSAGGPDFRLRDPPRADLTFEDFEKENYEGWTVAGSAFGGGPIAKDRMPAYQDDVGAQGKRLVNSHASAPGANVSEKDAATGMLTSKPFVMERDFINFLVGGGSTPGRTCVNLIVEGKTVDSATGANDNRMQPHTFDVRGWPGRSAQLQIVDNARGGWGNIGVDHIVFSDRPSTSAARLEDQPDFGTMGLALLEAQETDVALAQFPADPSMLATVFSEDRSVEGPVATNSFDVKWVGALRRKLALAPSQTAAVTFVLTWHFPRLELGKLGQVGRYYASKHQSAQAVAQYVVDNFERLISQTRLWHDTWYDSTLPYWFLDRTFLNTSILATSTCFRFRDGRFYAWEGVGCCAGTCAHVWHYAQAMARIFPALERDTRERVDLGLAMNPDGGIGFRAEFDRGLAVDAQAGTILRIYREHQMSSDATFLQRHWPQIKKAFDPLLRLDADDDGLLEGPQMNTLDQPWYGKIAWLSSLYLAALRAGEKMAIEMGETDFAGRCRGIVERGGRNMVEQLFEGEYFINQVDPQHPQSANSGTGCEIDQVLGQGWAFQVALGRVLPEKETRAALRALWKFNFTPDVGPYRAVFKSGRWYAMAGEAGLLMCTFPRRDWDFDRAKGTHEGFAGYFNECMNGFEYQVAGHMIGEGLVLEGLAVARAVHDRYHASRRNPWNEIECGDHYARSMASYGLFIAACGFEYHGPEGHIGFAPRLTPDNFQAAFTAAEGWGTYRQEFQISNLKSEISLKWGKLRVRTMAFEMSAAMKPTVVRVVLNDKNIPCSLAASGRRVTITLTHDALVEQGQKIEVTIR